MSEHIVRLTCRNCDEWIIDSLVQLEKECFGALAWTKSALLEEINNTFSIVGAYIVGKEIVGYINARIVIDELQIGNVAVFAKHRNKGYATELINYILELAQQNKCCSAQLEVALDNDIAINLYQNFDFEKVGVRKNFYSGCSHGSKDAYTMVKQL